MSRGLHAAGRKKRKRDTDRWSRGKGAKERDCERGSGRRRDDEYITYGGESRFESCAGSIVLLREAGRSLSLSHAALIAHRSLIYVVGGSQREREREKWGEGGGETRGRETGEEVGRGEKDSRTGRSRRHRGREEKQVQRERRKDQEESPGPAWREDATVVFGAKNCARRWISLSSDEQTCCLVR